MFKTDTQNTYLELFFGMVNFRFNIGIVLYRILLTYKFEIL